MQEDVEGNRMQKVEFAGSMMLPLDVGDAKTIRRRTQPQQATNCQLQQISVLWNYVLHREHAKERKAKSRRIHQAVDAIPLRTSTKALLQYNGNLFPLTKNNRKRAS